MEFCPTCGNMLLFKLASLEQPARFSCPTCPYKCQIETKVQLRRRVRLVKKPIDPIFSADDMSNFPETAENCPACNHGKANFAQAQTRSADEPMTIFYACVKCKYRWNEN